MGCFVPQRIKSLDQVLGERHPQWQGRNVKDNKNGDSLLKDKQIGEEQPGFHAPSKLQFQLDVPAASQSCSSVDKASLLPRHKAKT